jgi:tRNA uridine 5-carboxymethylaminomethyl modification enzyme
LRQDNADLRLTPKGFAIGLSKEDRLRRMEYKRDASEAFLTFFKETSLKPDEANPVLVEKGSSPMTQPDKMYKVFSRPQLDLEDFIKFEKVANYIQEHNLDSEIIEQAEIQVKYAGYIEKEKNHADKVNRLEDVMIPSNFDFDKIKSISIEARQKLNKIRPTTIAQASRISGVSPSDISVLLIYMGR